MLPKSRFLRSASAFTIALAGAAFLFACASAPAAVGKKKKTPVDPGDDFFTDDPTTGEQGLSPTANTDSGAFTPASARPASGSSSLDDGGAPARDGSAADSGTGGSKVFCAGPPQAGDLAITEMLIASRTGALDDGEWVEVTSTRSCWLKLQGLSIESPRGTSVDGVAITDDLELAPGGTFVVADSADPTKNHGLPGTVLSWNASDVLKNDGDTVSLKLGATLVDTVTYPAFSNLVPGRTLAFPSDCPAGVRTDWGRWSLTFHAYSVGFEGTPNATNDDVACY